MSGLTSAKSEIAKLSKEVNQFQAELDKANAKKNNLEAKILQEKRHRTEVEAELATITSKLDASQAANADANKIREMNMKQLAEKDAEIIKLQKSQTLAAKALEEKFTLEKESMTSEIKRLQDHVATSEKDLERVRREHAVVLSKASDQDSKLV